MKQPKPSTPSQDEIDQYDKFKHTHKGYCPYGNNWQTYCPRCMREAISKTHADDQIECGKLILDTRIDATNKTLSEVFAELEKEGFMDNTFKEPSLTIGYHTYKNLKKRFGVKI